MREMNDGGDERVIVNGGGGSGGAGKGGRGGRGTREGMSVQQDLLWKLCPSLLPAEGGNNRAAGFSQEVLLFIIRPQGKNIQQQYGDALFSQKAKRVIGTAWSASAMAAQLRAEILSLSLAISIHPLGE